MTTPIKAASALAVLFFAAPAQALPVYIAADFSGSITNTPRFGEELGLQRSQLCPDCPAGFVSGQVLFDSSLIPGSGSGTVSIPLASVDSATDDLIFSISLGSQPLEFNFGGGTGAGASAIQFKDGVFDGFSFSEIFLHDGNSFRFSISGSNWDIKVGNSNGVYSQLAASGSLNVGGSGLFNQENFIPGSPPAETPAQVPEPATLLLLALGLAAMAVPSFRIGRKTPVLSTAM